MHLSENLLNNSFQPERIRNPNLGSMCPTFEQQRTANPQKKTEPNKSRPCETLVSGGSRISDRYKRLRTPIASLTNNNNKTCYCCLANGAQMWSNNSVWSAAAAAVEAAAAARFNVSRTFNDTVPPNERQRASESQQHQRAVRACTLRTHFGSAGWGGGWVGGLSLCVVCLLLIALVALCATNERVKSAC